MRILVIGLLFVALGARADVPVDLPGRPHFAKVSDGLYRGAQPTAEGYRAMRDELGIKTVINLRLGGWVSCFEDPYCGDDEPLIRGLGLRYAHIPWDATQAPGYDPRYDQIVQFLKVAMDPENQPVFVHCRAGQDRTGVAVEMYRYVAQHWTPEQVEAELGVAPVRLIFGSPVLQDYLKDFADHPDKLEALERKLALTPEQAVRIVP